MCGSPTPRFSLELAHYMHHFAPGFDILSGSEIGTEGKESSHLKDFHAELCLILSNVGFWPCLSPLTYRFLLFLFNCPIFSNQESLAYLKESSPK